MNHNEILADDPLKEEEYILLEKMLKVMVQRQPEETRTVKSRWEQTNNLQARQLLPEAGQGSGKTDCSDHQNGTTWERNVITEKSYETIIEYGDAVFDYINRTIKKHGIQAAAKSVREGVRALSFDTGMTVFRTESRVLCDFRNCSYTIELIICRDLPGRFALAGHLVKEEKYKPKYGEYVTDKDTYELKLVFRSGFRGAFSMHAFSRCFSELMLTYNHLCLELPH